MKDGFPLTYQEVELEFEKKIRYESKGDLREIQKD
jgi:hypothetical protein